MDAIMQEEEEEKESYTKFNYETYADKVKEVKQAKTLELPAYLFETRKNLL